MLCTNVFNHKIDIIVSDHFFLGSKRQAPPCGENFLEIVLPRRAKNAASYFRSMLRDDAASLLELSMLIPMLTLDIHAAQTKKPVRSAPRELATLRGERCLLTIQVSCVRYMGNRRRGTGIASIA